MVNNVQIRVAKLTDAPQLVAIYAPYVQKTASGTIPTAGRTVAVDTDVIPFGTVLIIDGYEYVAEDTGSAVNGNVIDIYFDSHESACEYGVQYKTIYIKGE